MDPIIKIQRSYYIRIAHDPPCSQPAGLGCRHMILNRECSLICRVFQWFDKTRAVTPLNPETGKGLPETFPFGV
jgi:hypothetical protein